MSSHVYKLQVILILYYLSVNSKCAHPVALISYDIFFLGVVELYVFTFGICHNKFLRIKGLELKKKRYIHIASLQT